MKDPTLYKQIRLGVAHRYVFRKDDEGCWVIGTEEKSFEGTRVIKYDKVTPKAGNEFYKELLRKGFTKIG